MSTKPKHTTVLLADETPRLYQPHLVRLLGAHEAMVIQQLHYLLSLDNSGREHDGHHWVWKTYDELGDELGLSWAQVKRALSTPREIGLIVSIRNPVEGWNATPWYRINYDHQFLQETKSSSAVDESVQCRDESVSSSRRIRRMQKTKSSDRVDESGSAITESTSIEDGQEKTSPTPTKRTPDSARDSVSVSVQDKATGKQTATPTAKETPQQRMAKLRADAAARAQEPDSAESDQLAQLRERVKRERKTQ